MAENTTVVKFTDGREILLSYGTPVAAFIPRGCHPRQSQSEPEIYGYVKTARKYSVTTSKHANAYAGDSAQVVPDDVFCSLVAPLETKR